VAIEVAVFEFDPGRRLTIGLEADLDLAGLGVVGLEFPVGRDVPAEDQPPGWLVGEDP